MFLVPGVPHWTDKPDGLALKGNQVSLSPAFLMCQGPSSLESLRAQAWTSHLEQP